MPDPGQMKPTPLSWDAPRSRIGRAADLLVWAVFVAAVALVIYEVGRWL